jgi:hypothetical protein
MDCHPEDAQIGHHQKDAATGASDQLQTHGSSERTGKRFWLFIKLKSCNFWQLGMSRAVCFMNLKDSK